MNQQAQMVFEEIGRLRRLDPQLVLGDIAVVARTHQCLVPLRVLCELADWRYMLARQAGFAAWDWASGVRLFGVAAM